MSEKEPSRECFFGETIKREAMVRHFEVYRDPEHWDFELRVARWAIDILLKDTGIPLRDSTLEMIEIKHGIESK